MSSSTPSTLQGDVVNVPQWLGEDGHEIATEVWLTSQQQKPSSESQTFAHRGNGIGIGRIADSKHMNAAFVQKGQIGFTFPVKFEEEDNSSEPVLARGHKRSLSQLVQPTKSRKKPGTEAPTAADYNTSPFSNVIQPPTASENPFSDVFKPQELQELKIAQTEEHLIAADEAQEEKSSLWTTVLGSVPSSLSEQSVYSNPFAIDLFVMPPAFNVGSSSPVHAGRCPAEVGLVPEQVQSENLSEIQKQHDYNKLFRTPKSNREFLEQLKALDAYWGLEDLSGTASEASTEDSVWFWYGEYRNQFQATTHRIEQEYRKYEARADQRIKEAFERYVYYLMSEEVFPDDRVHEALSIYKRLVKGKSNHPKALENEFVMDDYFTTEEKKGEAYVFQLNLLWYYGIKEKFFEGRLPRSLWRDVSAIVDTLGLEAGQTLEDLLVSEYVQWPGDLVED